METDAVTIYVYSLRDPITGTTRYVGQTYDPKKRLTAHMGNHTDLMEPWIKSLRERCLRPVLVVLEVCDCETCDAAEARWIDLYRAEGCPLLNRPGRAAPARRHPLIPYGAGRPAPPECKPSEVTVPEAAVLAGCDRSKIYHALRQQRLQSRVVRDKWYGVDRRLIDKASVESWCSALAEEVPERRAGKVSRFILTSPEGEDVEVVNLAAWCRGRGLRPSCFYPVLKGTLRHHKGWRIRRPPTP
jgi:hypothetical protein